MEGEGSDLFYQGKLSGNASLKKGHLNGDGNMVREQAILYLRKKNLRQREQWVRNPISYPLLSWPGGAGKWGTSLVLTCS